MKAVILTLSPTALSTCPITQENILKIADWPADAKVLEFNKIENDPLRGLEVVIGSDRYEDKSRAELPSVAITEYRRMFHTAYQPGRIGSSFSIYTARPISTEVYTALCEAGINSIRNW